MLLPAPLVIFSMWAAKASVIACLYPSYLKELDRKGD